MVTDVERRGSPRAAEGPATDGQPTNSARTRTAASVAPLLLLAMVLPLVPRPTAGGILAVLAPGVLLLALVAFVAVGGLRVPLRGALAHGFALRVALLLGILALDGTGILVRQSWDELLYFGSRVLVVAGIVIISMWLGAAPDALRRTYRALTTGYLVLAALILWVGITGVGIFEPAAPARVYGVEFPFAKNSGVPRSFAELSIIAIGAWAYVLTWGRRHQLPLRVLAGAVIAFSMIVSQARTVFLAAAVVTIAYALLRARPSRSLARWMLLAVLTVPLFAEIALTAVRGSAPATALIGEDTTEENVEARLTLYRLAWQQIRSADLGELLFGLERSSWADSSTLVFGQSLVLHNHTLATILFFGVIGGSLALVLLYVAPALTIIGHGLQDESRRFAFLLVLGSLTSLQFYEGAFSPVLMLHVAATWFVAYAYEGSTADPTERSERRPQRRRRPDTELATRGVQHPEPGDRGD